MAVCTYAGQVDCTAPNFGGGSAAGGGSHLNLFQHLFGTSWTGVIGSLIVIAIVALLVYRFALSYIMRLVLDYKDFKRLQDRPIVFLELTPPLSNTKTLHAIAEYYTHLNGMLSIVTRQDKRWQHRHVMELAIVGNRAEGIRFVASLSPSDVDLFKHVLIASQPDVSFRHIEDYLPPNLSEKDVEVMDFRQLGHSAMPIALHDKLEEYDPITSITQALSRTTSDELIVYQLVISRASERSINKVRRQLMHGNDKALTRKWWHWPFIVIFGILKVVSHILFSTLEMIGHDISGVQIKPEPYKYAPPQLSPVTQHMIDPIHHKLDQPLFSVDIRALVISHNNEERALTLATALHQFQVPGYQGFIRRGNFPKKYVVPYRLLTFAKRLPAMFSASSNVLAADELAMLYHFPYGEHVHGEDMVKSLTNSLPAPLAMKRHHDDADYDIKLGLNQHHGNTTVIGLMAKERETHVYLIGSTGTGKTTTLEYALLQDIMNGKGAAFIDPHGDSSQKILRYIPKTRLSDVIYVNPIDIKYPIGLNILELPEGLDEDELLIEKERVAEAAVSVLRKVFADDEANAHRIEAMFRNAIHTAFSVKGATLFTILKLLRNSEYRNKVISKLDNEFLKDYWREEFGHAGNMQQVSMSKGLTHRIDRFLTSQPVYRMMSQEKSTINFADIINSGKILICNFSTEMGEDTSTLFGTTILALLKIAAERRSPLPEEERRPFYVYVDEFQNFATTPFVKMLSSSRKYKLFLTMAEQSTAQQEEQRLTEAILANVNTLICFSLGSPADERLLLGRFEPWLKKGDLLNQASYNFYMRVKAGKPMEPVSGETVVLPREQASAERADEVIAASRKKYATEYVAPPKTNDTIKKSSQTPPTRTKNKADPPKPKNSGVTKRAVGRRNSRNNRKKPK